MVDKKEDKEYVDVEQVFMRLDPSITIWGSSAWLMRIVKLQMLKLFKATNLLA